MKQMLGLLTSLLTTINAWSQIETKQINGLVHDGPNGGLPGATVRLLRVRDSSLVAGTTTDTTGSFTFTNLTNDGYQIHVSNMGYKPYRGSLLTISDEQPQIRVPVVVLVSSATMLTEVVAVGRRTVLVQDLDKTIIQVDAMVGSAGNNTLEILSKTPGVSVDADGAISLNGSGEVLVLIDNRPTYLSRQDLAAYLKSLPGGALNTIELLSNPPARYDAAGSAVINIRLKKTTLLGLTASMTLNYNQGITARSNNVLLVNYKRKLVNFFGSISYIKDGNYTRDTDDRQFFAGSVYPIRSVDLASQYRYTSRGISTRFGVDYTPSKRTGYGFSVQLQNRPRQDELNYTNRSYDSVGRLTSVGLGSTIGNYAWSSRELNLNFTHQWPRQGRELAIDLTYIDYRSRGNQDLSTQQSSSHSLPLDSREFVYKLPWDITIYSAKADYQQPLWAKAKLEAGLKSSLVINDNESNYYARLQASEVIDYRQSNHFIYREKITAAYVNTRLDGRRLAIQFGLRGEHTGATGQQLGNAAVQGSSFIRSYLGLFPNAALRYKLDSSGRHALLISLSRRINRPTYTQLNPFLFYRDNYSYSSGNPALTPQYNYITELKYQYAQFLTVGVRYGFFTNMIFTTTQVADSLFLSRPGNIATGQQLALTTTATCSPRRWWQLNANLTLAHLALQGDVANQVLNSRATIARLNWLNQFRLGNHWRGELGASYASGDLAGQTVIAQRYRLNAAFQQDVMQGKGSIRFVFDDLFHSWIQRDQTLSLGQAQSYHTSLMDTQRVGLAFSYRFGNEVFGRKRTHTDDGADDEKGRAID